MACLEIFINNKTIKVSNLIKITIIYYQFKTVHSFCDGNGMLKLLIILYLINLKYWIKLFYIFYIFLKNYKSTYYNYLTNVRKNNDIK